MLQSYPVPQRRLIARKKFKRLLSKLIAAATRTSVAAPFHRILILFFRANLNAHSLNEENIIFNTHNFSFLILSLNLRAHQNFVFRLEPTSCGKRDVMIRYSHERVIVCT